MKKSVLFTVLLTILLGFLPYLSAFGQTYSVSPSGWTSKPSKDVTSNGSTWIAATTQGTYIIAKASVSGSNVTFNVQKNDNSTFQNKVSIAIQKDVIISGSNVTNTGTTVVSKSLSAGNSGTSINFNLDFTTGSHTYTVVLASGSIIFYTSPITIKVQSSVAKPSNPSSPSPSDGATNVSTSGDLSWSCGGTDFNYDLYLATDPDFKNRVGGTNAYDSGKGNFCSYSNLKEGQTYYWKVCVWDADGNSYWIDGNKSNYWSFTTKKSSVAKPSNPSSPSPSDGATNVSTSGNLSWSCGGTDFNYDLYLATDADFKNRVGGTNAYNSGKGNSCSYSNLKEGQTYYWKVCVWDADGNSYWIDGNKSNYWSFTTGKSSTAKPSNPSSPSPSNGATNVATSGKLSWSCGGTDFNYDLYLATDADFKNRVGGTNAYDSGKGNSCSYSNLKEGQNYYWKVCVWDADGNSYWIDGNKSNYWSFTTGKSSTAKPSNPSSPSPSNGATNVATSGKLSWSCGGTDFNYDLYLATDANFKNRVGGTDAYRSGRGNSCSYSNLQEGQTYYWKVCVWDSDGNTYWIGGDKSKYWNFTTAKSSSSSLGTFDFNTINVSNLTSTGVTVSWGEVSGATSYDVRLYTAGTTKYILGSGTPGRVYCSFSGLTANTNYEICIRAKNSSHTGAWSDRYTVKTVAATSNNELTEPAELYLYDQNGFKGVKSFTVNSSYHYVACVENKENATWIGHFFLKDGNDLIKAWYSEKISKHGANYLEFDYIPSKSGTKTFTLYYQTAGNGGGRLVSNGQNVYNNLSIYVQDKKAAPSFNLKLNNAISYPTSVDLGGSANFVATIMNDGNDEWSGSLCFTDNKKILSPSSYTLKKGDIATISYQSWTPSSDNNHDISVYYKTSGESEWKQVSSNGFTIPVSITVTNGNVTNSAKYAKLRIITKDCAPVEVNEGDEIFYYCRITDDKGQPLKGLKAQFSCSTTKRMFETQPTDIEGYTVLSLKTKGDDAFAGRGETATFNCIGIVDNNDNNNEISLIGDSNNRFTLSIRKGLNSFTEGIQSVSVTFDRGVTGESKFGSIASASASLSFPLTTSLLWNGNKMLTVIESEAKGEADGSIDIKNCFEGGLGFELGIKESTTYNWSVPERTGLALILSWFDATQMFTSSRTMKSIMAIESWFGVKHEDGEGFYAPILEKYNTGWFWGANVSGKLNKTLKNWPVKYGVMPGTLFPDLEIPTDQTLLKGSVSLSASFKNEPKKEEFDFASSKYLYGSSRQLKAKISGNISSVFETFSPTQGSFYEFVPKNSLETYSGLYKSSFDHSWSSNASCVLTTKEDEMYTTDNMKTLNKISNSFGVEGGFNLSVESIKNYICPEWMDANSSNEKKSKLSIGGSISWNWKMSSSGNFASDLQRLSETSTDVADIYPAFGHKNTNYIIDAPVTACKLFTDNYLENALIQVTSQMKGNYSIKEALKLEQQETDKIEIKMSVPIAKWSLFGVGIDISLDCGLAFNVSYYPSETYYSVLDKRFFPVILRGNKTALSIIKDATSFLKTKIDNVFSNGDKEEISKHAGKTFDLNESELSHQMCEVSNRNKPHFNNYNKWLVRKRAPRLAEIQQNDICTFTFSLNDETQNFDEGTILNTSHFYPMGKLIGITDLKDTVFVVSEVFDLVAVQGNDTLSTTNQGKIKMETTVGADDLIPFGFSDDTPLDVYYSDRGSDIWQYVGPVGSTVMIDKLGSYMMATSIKNDLISPEISLDYDENNGIILINVSDNIAIRTKSLAVYINGELKEVTLINESNFEVQISQEDLDYRIDVKAYVYDLAGNKGEITQMFQLDKPEKINIESQPDTDIAELENTIYTELVSATAGKDFTLSVKMKNSVEAESFQFDLELPKGVTVVTDEDGFAEADLSLERTTKRKTDTFSTSFLENGTLRVIAGSTGGYTFSGNDGEVATINLHIDNNVAAGYYPIVLRNISISDTEAVSHDVAYVKSTIYVGEGLIGDVNGDDVVNAQDVIALVNYMMGKMQLDLNAADVNGDGVVNIADVIMVSNSILKN